MSECCTPDRSALGTADPTHIGVRTLEPPPKSITPPHTMIDIATAPFTMGTVGPSAIPGDGEGPEHVVDLSPYSIAPHTVTNAEFAEFVQATDYRTDAERFRWSFVFGPFLPDDFPDTRGVVEAPWWRQVFGADWCHPEGPTSTLDGRNDHPVVHVSWRDAAAYCDWRNVRLPTEAEWENAGSWWSQWLRLPVGRRAGAGRTPQHERLPRHLSGDQHCRRRLRRYGPGRCVRAERLRPASDDRQRVGVVRGLVLPDLLRLESPASTRPARPPALPA